MLQVTDTASSELTKVLAAPEHKDKKLILYFQGAGWSGPVIGMALDESTDKLQLIESNGISAYIDPKVLTYLQQYGDINIDFVTRDGQSGYMISVGDPGCSPDQCAGCSSGQGQ